MFLIFVLSQIDDYVKSGKKLFGSPTNLIFRYVYILSYALGCGWGYPVSRLYNIALS